MDDSYVECGVGATVPEDHPIAHIRSGVTLLGFAHLCNYIPLAAVVALLRTPGPIPAWLLFAVLSSGMATVVYCSFAYFRWLASGQVRNRQMAAVLGGVSLVSFLLASGFGLGWC